MIGVVLNRYFLATKKLGRGSTPCYVETKTFLLFAISALFLIFFIIAISENEMERDVRLYSNQSFPDTFFDYSEYRSVAPRKNDRPDRDKFSGVRRNVVFKTSLSKGKKRQVLEAAKIIPNTLENHSSACPVVPPNLVGRKNVSLTSSEEDTLAYVRQTNVLSGGTWKPDNCAARYRVAIIVPYRDRPEQVWVFLSHMHQFLQKQQIHYTIYIVEQAGEDLFNRAKLLNVGFAEATKDDDSFDCFVFHDVDMLPEDDRHLYHCSPMPRHLVVASSNNKYRSSLSFQRDRYFGGACMMTAKIFTLVNGWANRYWGWGGEDDDMWRRVSLHDLPVWRYPAAIARYTMIPHGSPPGVNKHSYADLERFSPQHRKDGLNNLHYQVALLEKKEHHTRIVTDIGKPPKEN